MSPGSPDVDAFIARLPDDTRMTLEKLRASIKAAAPDAIESISYGVPNYRLGRQLVSFGAAKSHCSFYLQSTAILESHTADLTGYDASGGTVRFAPGTPLPDALIRKLVAARIAENAALDATR